jgi:glycosyltransferase involved in cell wall biosynthesis
VQAAWDLRVIVSVVIRTLNEQTYLAELLGAIEAQELPARWQLEVVVVDSGSTDATLKIAERFGSRVTHIAKEEFSFGRSLNRGCEFARGSILVFISGHCVPVGPHWLVALVKPLEDNACSYSYGRQIGGGPTKFSEGRVFLKYFPPTSMLPQEGFFANNANAAIRRSEWQALLFDETLTGLEDMHLAKRLVESGGEVGYVAEAAVHHIHDETWAQVRNRYEREGAALVEIMPEAGLSFLDFLECTARSIAKDSYAALREGALLRELPGIVMFRTVQYWGSYRGTSYARMVASMRRKAYFHPDRQFEKKAGHSGS